ncbi:MAG: hypothetical protein ACE5HB_10165 [Terriglobia bacterium]
MLAFPVLVSPRSLAPIKAKRSRTSLAVSKRILRLPRHLRFGPAFSIRVRIRKPGAAVVRAGRAFYRGRYHPFTLHRIRKNLLVRWGGIGDFLIERRGRLLTVWPAPASAPGSVRDFLVTVASSFALLEQGVESLHASAVTLKGRGVAFLGPPGCGKSTLAAWFARRGRRVVADDFLVIHRKSRRLLAYPGLAEIKLSRAAGRALGLRWDRLPAIEPGNPKRIWQAPRTRRAQRLAALYFLRLRGSSRGGVRLRRLAHPACFRALLACAYNPTLGTRGRLRRQFDLLTRLAASVPAKQLILPRGWKHLEEARTLIEQDLARLAR